MKRNSIITIILFVLTMVLLCFSAIQKQTNIFKFDPLEGVFFRTPNPELTFDNYRTATYQTQLESHLKENFGFREPLIRLYNQFLFDVFRKTYNKDIVMGKDGWLYFIQHVNDYYGTELYRWHSSNESARQAYDREALRMWKLHGVLKDYGVDFLVFMAPQKGFLYPEHLPERQKDTTTINAREYFCDKFDEYGIPYVEMTKWFIDIKEADTLPYSFFPQTGAHWGFSAAMATDSLLRFMGDLKGITLPKLKFGPLKESDKLTLKSDRDIELLANLLRPLPHDDDRLLDSEVTFVIDSTTTQTSATFVGTSFLMRMYYYVPFSEIFPGSQYWYYNSTVYFGEGYTQMTKVSELDILQRLLESDYVVWFSEGDQMCKASFGFVESALLSMCVDDERVEDVKQHIIDSLRTDSATILKFKDFEGDALSVKLWEHTSEMLMRYPERFFSELAGDSIPTSRNPRIPEALVIKDIKQDSSWMMNLQCQTVIQNTTLEEVLKMEAQNIINGRPLMRDMSNVVSTATYVESLVKAMEEEIRMKPELMESIKEKAEKNKITLEQQVTEDARWIINYRIESGQIKL